MLLIFKNTIYCRLRILKHCHEIYDNANDIQLYQAIKHCHTFHTYKLTRCVRNFFYYLTLTRGRAPTLQLVLGTPAGDSTGAWSVPRSTVAAQRLVNCLSITSPLCQQLIAQRFAPTPGRSLPAGCTPSMDGLIPVHLDLR